MKKLILLFFALSFLFTKAQTVTTLTTSGNGNFTVPAGVTSIRVECWGAGGAGGGTLAIAGSAAGGGGGGAYASINLPVIPGENLSYTVGAGGIGVAATGGNGGDTYLNNAATVVLAKGGIGGGTGPLGAGGTGGLILSSIGSTKYAGGKGASGFLNNSGGGGGGAGSNSNGGDGTNPTGGLGSTLNGGNGGDGHNFSAGFGAGLKGLVYGGGGGGGLSMGTFLANGGDGAGGQIVLTYCINPLTVTLNTDNFPTSGGQCGDLRYAINFANNNPGRDSIAFNILGGGTKIIAPKSPLPNITDSLIINGRSNPGYADATSETIANHKLVIELDGSVYNITTGLSINGTANVLIRSLSIVGFSGYGILADASSDVMIEGNFIGLRANGTPAPNGNGIYFRGVTALNKFSYIGGGSPKDRNVISANNGDGIRFYNSSGAAVIRNFIGTDLNGASTLANKGYGVNSEASDNVNIGYSNAGFRNVIASNELGQILISNTTIGVSIVNNYIGVGSDGKTAIASPNKGISITNSKLTTIGSVDYPNIIANNGDAGIYFNGGSAQYNSIISNSIYANVTAGVILEGIIEQEAIVEPSISTATLNGDGSATFVLTPPAALPTINTVSFYADIDSQGQVFLATIKYSATNSYTLNADTLAKAGSLTKFTAIQTSSNGSSSAFSKAVTLTPYTPPTQPLGNRGMYFDGVDDYVNCGTPTSDVFGGTAPYTVELWVKMSKRNPDLQTLVSQYGSGGYPFNIWVQSDGTVMTYRHADDYNIKTTKIIPLNKWTHVAVTYNQPTLSIYIDGNLDVSSNKFNYQAIGTTPILFGANYNNGSNSNFFNGQLDEIRIFNNARAVSEIQADMGSTTPNGAVGYWNFEDDLAVNNQTVAANSGTLAGADGTLGANPTSPLWALRTTNNTSDLATDQGTLRWAITEANSDTDTDYIDFSIQQTDATIAGVSTIKPATELTITKPIFIDGYSAYGSSPNTAAFLSQNNAQIRTEINCSGIANPNHGINLSGVTNSLVQGLSIYGIGTGAGSRYQVVFTNTTNSSIQGSFIGIKADGTTNGGGMNGIGLSGTSSGDSIGGKSSKTWNVIGNQMFDGMQISASNNIIMGNYVGTDRSGNLASSNGARGVNITQSGNQVVDNLISGNSTHGIIIQLSGTSGAIVKGNYIGTKANLTGGLANGGNGIRIETGAINSIIGGSGKGEQNTIAFNNANGVSVDGNASVNHKISGNFIYCNATSGIALSSLGNKNKAFPVITSATSTLISGTSTGATDSVEIFRDSVGCSTADQGKVFLGKVKAVGGLWTYTPKATLAIGSKITATATDATNGTSPFSVAGLVAPPCNPFVVTSTLDVNTCGTLRFAITSANGSTSVDTITFNIPGATLPHVINLKSGFSSIGNTFIDGFSQPGSKSNTVPVFQATSADSMNAVYGIALDGTSVNYIISQDNFGLYLANSTVRGLKVQNFPCGIYSSGSQVLGCSVSKNVSGVILAGLNKIGDGTPEGANIISGNTDCGIATATSANGVPFGKNFIKGNMIGLLADGITTPTIIQKTGIKVYSVNSSIGGDFTKGEGNVISGNGTGVVISTTATSNAGSEGVLNSIKGNIIGLCADGKTEVATTPQLVGLQLESYSDTVGGTTNFRNIISGNKNYGIKISSITVSGLSGANFISNNYIGTDISGLMSPTVGSQEYGIFINEQSIASKYPNLVKENAIAFNTKGGIYCTGVYSIYNKYSKNFIFSNTNKGISNVSGGNSNKAIPVITSATPSLVSGTGSLAKDTIELFSNTPITKGTKVQGRTYVGFAIVQSDKSWSFAPTPTLIAGDSITATATEVVSNNTSEFSAAKVVAVPLVAPKATAATLVSKTGFRANWSKVTGATTYRLAVSKDNFVTDSAIFTVTAPADTFKVLTGLTAGNIYYYRVKSSTDGTNFSAYSNTKMTSTILPPGSGNGLTFNGTNYITVLHNPSLNFGTGDFSMEAWVKRDKLGTRMDVISKNQVTIDPNKDSYYQLVIETDNKVRIYTSNGGLNEETAGTTSIPVNQWVHLAAVRSGSTTRIYVNGVLDGTGASTHNVNSTDNLHFGTNFSPTSVPTNLISGSLDEVKLWNKALAQTEIQNQMCQKLTGSENGLVGYFRFDENTGTITENKAKGSTVDGTIVGIANWTYSGAPIGDVSKPEYTTGVGSVSFSNTDKLTIDNFTLAANQGIQVYKVNESPSQTGLGTGLDSLHLNSYFGVFPIGITEYKVTYDYSTTIIKGKKYESSLTFANRADNSIATWDKIANTTLDMTTYIMATPSTTLLTGQNEIIGAFALPPVPGAALDFDGGYNYVGTNLWTTALMNVTLEAIVLWKGGSDQSILFNGDSGDKGYGIAIKNDNGSGVLTILTGGSAWVSTGVVMTQNVWYHIAAVNDNGTWFLYLDGSPLALINSTAFPNPSTGVNLSTIGAAHAFENNFYGTIDEVRIWSRSLCEVEIQNNMNCEKPANQNGLIARYDFNQGIAGGDNSLLPADKIAVDSSGTGNHGTLSGFDLNGSTSNWVAPGKITSGSACTPLALSSVTTWIWTGAVSTDWFSPCNWDKFSVPVLTSDVIIPGKTTNQPTIAGSLKIGECNTITIDTDQKAMLTINKTSGAFLKITK